MPPQRRTESPPEPRQADPARWRSQWGLQFESTNGDVHELERAFWESRAASHQATAAVLSAGAAPKALQPAAKEAEGERQVAWASAGGCTLLLVAAVKHSPPPPAPICVQALRWCTAC